MSNFIKSLLQKNNKNVVIERFDGDFSAFNELENSAGQSLGIVFDLETTGLSHAFDEVIEISYIFFYYSSSTMEISKIGQQKTFLQEPKKELSKEVEIITSYTKDKLKGKKINWDEVQTDFEKAALIIAHNTAFDRGFIEKSIPTLKNKAMWACSLRHINWLEKGFSSANLELLSIYHGFFCDFHKASGDSNALMLLLTKEDYFQKLFNNLHRPFKIYKIQNFPFDEKAKLTQHKFRWNPKEKIWFRQASDLSDEDEVKLKTMCTSTGAFLEIISIPPTENFSSKWNF